MHFYPNAERHCDRWRRAGAARGQGSTFGGVCVVGALSGIHVAPYPNAALGEAPLAVEPPLNIRRFPAGRAVQQNLELAAVVVTIRNGASYDPAFDSCPQHGPEGTYVATYCLSGPLASILDAVRAEVGVVPHGTLGELMQDIRAVDPASVVFNLEGCSGYCNNSFGSVQETRAAVDFMKAAIDLGHMVVCSDFSLKALIQQWDSNHFALNPFVQIGEFDGKFKLRFDTETLARCPSAQLQSVGNLSETGRVEIGAMPYTIAYTVDSAVADATDQYELQVLTVAYGMEGIKTEDLPPNQRCNLGKHRGVAGHVMLEYLSGGILLTSCGHWSELLHMDVSEAQLIRTALERHGEGYAEAISTQLGVAPSIRAISTSFVLSSPPCTFVVPRTV